MKSILKTLIVVLGFLAIPSIGFAQDTKELVTVISVKRYVFHFKVDGSLMGGTVSVIDGNYKVVKTEDITTRKKIIDFFELRAGVYTIRIKKGDKEVNIQYENFQ